MDMHTEPRTASIGPLSAVLPACLLALALSGPPAQAQLSYPGCPDLKASDFAQVPLVNNAMDPTVQEPLKMAFDMDAQGNVDIYFTQRFGLLRKYSVAKKAMVTVADFAFTATQVPRANRNSLGLIGIALDPDFKTNHWMYFYIGFAREWKISRFVLNGEKLDMASEKVIFRFDPGPPDEQLTHVAGALQFDAEGNLWVTNADNETARQSANTNSYLGKIMRIKPRPLPDAGAAPAPGAGSTYDIPAGNLYPPGTAKTLPEIYVMGARNPYTIALDPVRKGVAWGDIGPDVPQRTTGTEEFNYTTAPGNFGYPYWAGDQQQLEAGHGTPAAPLNERPDNTGLRELKPAIAATVPFLRACAVTGPIYRYNPALKSPARLPPHLDGKWLVGDFNASWIDVVTLNDAGKASPRVNLLPVSGSDELSNPLELQAGPDGVLYAINYSGFRTWNAKTGLLRIEYRGNCHPVNTVPRAARDPAGPLGALGARLQGSQLTLEETGFHRLRVRGPDGRLEFQREGSGPATYDLGRALGRGLHHLEVSDGAGRVRKQLLFVL